MSLCGSGKTPRWLRPWPCHTAQQQPLAGRQWQAFQHPSRHLVQQRRTRLYSQLCAPRPAGSVKLVSNKSSEKKKRWLFDFFFFCSSINIFGFSWTALTVVSPPLTETEISDRSHCPTGKLSNVCWSNTNGPKWSLDLQLPHLPVTGSRLPSSVLIHVSGVNRRRSQRRLAAARLNLSYQPFPSAQKPWHFCHHSRKRPPSSRWCVLKER